MENRCKKVYFATEHDALFYISKINKTSNRAKKPVRTYLCNKCNSWHLTSSSDYKQELVLAKEEISRLNQEFLNIKERHKQEISLIKSETNINTNKDKVISEYQSKLSFEKRRNRELNLSISDVIAKNNYLTSSIDAFNKLSFVGKLKFIIKGNVINTKRSLKDLLK